MRAALTGIALVVAGLLGTPAVAGAAITIGPPTATSAGEGGTLTFTITRSMDVTALTAATVHVATTDGTATAGADYTPISQTVTLGSSALAPTTATVSVPVLGDALDEADEDFTVALTTPANDTLGSPSTARGVITDDDAAPVLALGTPAPAPEDAAASLAFPVTLSAASGRAVSVAYATADGTATAGLDYGSSSGTLTIPAGQTTAAIPVPVLADTIDEADETVSMSLSSPVDATISPGASSASGTITDDDVATLSVGAAPVREGTGTTTATTATVTLSTTSAVPVSVGYATMDGTATAPADYTPSSGRVTIAPGQRSAVIPLAVVGDATHEENEVFGVQLSAPAGAAIAAGGDLAPVLVLDDDAAPPPTVGTVLTTPPPATGTATGTTTDAVAAKPVRLGRLRFTRATGTLAYRVTCPLGAGRCRVVVTVFSVPATRSKVKALQREQQLGTKTVTVPAGTTVTARMHLSRRARGWLRTAHTIRVNAYAVSRDAARGYSTARRPGTLKG